jgi:predicted Rdx family selenoprotein
VRAASLAAELNRAGHTADAVQGAKSQFDVLTDGQVIFSKQREGRFPDAEEMLAALQDAS